MISNIVGRQKNDLMRDLSSFGSLLFYILVMILSLLLQNYSLFYRLLIGLVIIYIITIILRIIFFKERPMKLKHESFIEKLDAASFPSLHATRSAFMCLIFINYFNNAILSMLMFLLVISIAYSRIYLKKHDIRDVVAGLIIGIIIYFGINLIL